MEQNITEIEFILYVNNQQLSSDFYENTLLLKPSLNVPGMTEFKLSPGVKLGLMPNSGIAKILKNKVSQPSTGNGIPRCEIYLKVENPELYIKRGIEQGGKLISNLKHRDWGDKVGYICDLDTHILAFVEKNI